MILVMAYGNLAQAISEEALKTVDDGIGIGYLCEIEVVRRAHF